MLPRRKALYDAAQAQQPPRWNGPKRNWNRITVPRPTPNRAGHVNYEPGEASPAGKKTA